ncbi:MAG: hypothetical protein ACE5JM_04235 [Armatimonadota bacterium]
MMEPAEARRDKVGSNTNPGGSVKWIAQRITDEQTYRGEQGTTTKG